MADSTNTPVIFLAFANDRGGAVGKPLNLPEEERRLREALEAGENDGLCEVIVRSNCTAGDIFKVLQDPKYRNRIAIFHYGGHANGYQLLLESAEGKAAAADAGGLAAFVAQQQGLQLVFLNGCSTQQQTQGLLEANITAVIATSRAIDDQVATDFSVRFYYALARGATLRTAYNEASAEIKTTKGGGLRALYFGNADKPGDHRNERGFPWNLYQREGSERADQWNLPEAVNDPLFGLPPLPEQDLPESPYRRLNWFTREDAEVFFGRGHQIRELYDRLNTGTQPIILFYGQSGVGKSSILDAGLIPRLERDNEVRYLRRAPDGLLATLQSELLKDAADVPIETAWLAREERLKKPLIIFLDQVEEFYTRPIEDFPDELDQLLRVLDATFGDPKRRPIGKLVLGFREEWLAKLEARVKEYQLPRTKVFLKPLDSRGIIEVVQGPTHTKRLKERYALTVEPGLAELIAVDLLADRGSAIATTLQILLSKMWKKATEANSKPPHFTQKLYLDLKRQGILLGDFLDEQLEEFRSGSPDTADSGLLLDLLAQHTTALGTADQCSSERLREQYAHVKEELPTLLQQCQDLYLLTEAGGTQKDGSKTTRLAHDTLAPLVRERFDRSDRPGQRARVILDAKSPAWVLSTTEPDDLPIADYRRRAREMNVLGEMDLKTVEEGEYGTRQWNDAENRLVKASRQARARRRRRAKALRIVAVFATVLIALSAGVASWQWHIAAEGRKSYLAQKNWGNRRVDYYRNGLRSIQRHIRTIGEETEGKLDPSAKQKVDAILVAAQSVLIDTTQRMVLPKGETVRVIRVHYVTTRRMEDGIDYGHRRNAEGPEYGYCDVSIPKSHKRGQIESPAFGAMENLSLHMELQVLQRTNHVEFRQQMEPWAEEDGRRVLVFVHTWNMTFDEAVLRAAQLAVDIEFEGEIVLFSWPSRSSTWAYSKGTQELSFSADSFNKMLDELAKVRDDEDIDVLGHGLGAELVATGCAKWLEATPGRRLGNVVFASADIDTDRFELVLAPRLAAGARCVTVYVNPDDKALAAASQIHAGPRIGAKLVEISGVDTIQISFPDQDLIGHMYYATSSLMLTDLALLLRGFTATERRLQRVGGHYELK